MEEKGLYGALKTNYCSTRSVFGLTMAEGFAKYQKISNENDPFMILELILGYVAKVERLFSFANYFMPDHRKSMSPKRFEAIIFLKSSERLWEA